MDAYHTVLGILGIYIPVRWRASKSSPVVAAAMATATTAATTGLSIRERVSPGNCYSRLRKHLRHDLIVSAAAYTARTRTRTHSYARHVHARICGADVCTTCAGHVHTDVSVLYAR